MNSQDPVSCVALLRGINVGTQRRINMADLRLVMYSRGFARVTTVLNSGNICLSVPPEQLSGLAEEIAATILADLGAVVPVVVRTEAEIDAVIAANPLRSIATDPARYVVTFLDEVPEPGAVMELQSRVPEEVAVLGADCFVWAPNGVSQLQASAEFIGKVLDRSATARNWSTVLKIQAELCL